MTDKAAPSETMQAAFHSHFLSIARTLIASSARFESIAGAASLSTAI
jgi:hypothetical protein